MNGLPRLPKSPNAPVLAQTLLGAAQASLFRKFQIDSGWSITHYGGPKNGKPLTDVRHMKGAVTSVIAGALGLQSSISTVSFDYVKSAMVSDFPIERGGFASYNKVELPATPVVSLAITGTVDSRRKFLNDIERACKSTELFTIATPSKVFSGYSINQFGYRQSSSHGANLIVVDLQLKEVREVIVALTTNEKLTKNSKSNTAKPLEDSGKVAGENATEQSFARRTLGRIKKAFSL